MEWLILLLVLVAVVIGVALVANRARSAALRERFGTEYERAIEAHGDRRSAEAGLRAVAKRRGELDIRPLSVESRDRYALRWRDAQARFVDAPVRAVAEADSLVGQVLRERGYPTGDFDEQVALIAADHGDRAEDYREAFAIHRGAGGDTSTDDLRGAFLRYRAVFQSLVADPEAPAGTPVAADADGERGEPPTWAGTPGTVPAETDAGGEPDADGDADADEAARRRQAEMDRREDVERRIATARSTERGGAVS
jgi:hypothetical protein